MSVTINSPAAGATLKGTATVTATFVGSGFDIATVTLAGKQLASDSARPLSFSIDTTRVADGAHTLTVAVRAGSPKRWQKASLQVIVKNVAARPSVPTGLTARPADGKVTLSWDANPATQGVDSYQVYKDDGNYDLDVTGTSFVVTGLTNGTRYEFRVSAHNAQGFGDWTAPVTAVPVGALPSNVARSTPTGKVSP